jgi:hypothetical protein
MPNLGRGQPSGEDNPRDLKGARCTPARVNRRLIAHGASERGRRVGPRVAEGSEAGLLEQVIAIRVFKR